MVASPGVHSIPIERDHPYWQRGTCSNNAIVIDDVDFAEPSAEYSVQLYKLLTWSGTDSQG